MTHYYVSIAERSLLCRGNNITRFNPCSYLEMIQLVTPGPKLAKHYVKNRGVWKGALIIWIFSELIYIITSTHNTGLAVEQIVLQEGLTLLLDCVFVCLCKWHPNYCNFKPLQTKWKGKAIRNLFKPRHNCTIFSIVLTPCSKQIVQEKKKQNPQTLPKKGIDPLQTGLHEFKTWLPSNTDGSWRDACFTAD